MWVHLRLCGVLWGSVVFFEDLSGSMDIPNLYLATLGYDASMLRKQGYALKNWVNICP